MVCLESGLFVGGSLNEPGERHNILEPMVLNIPTVIGPRYFNFQSIVDEFVAAQGILIGENAAQVAQQLLSCLDDPLQTQQQVAHAQQVCSAIRVLYKNISSCLTTIYNKPHHHEYCFT